MKKLILFALSITLLLSGCSSDKTGNFQLYLTDQPIPDIENVYVTISEIGVKKQGEEAFTTIWEGEKTYDLLTLRNREERILDIELEQGTYTQIKIVVESAAIVIRGQTFELSIPSIAVIIPVVFTIMEDGVTEVVLDFEADNSIDIDGLSYILRPVITVERIGY